MAGGRWPTAALVLLAATLSGQGLARAELAVGESLGPVVDLPNSPDLRSRNGRLDAVFVARPGKVTVATDRVTSNVYNDLYIPPMLRHHVAAAGQQDRPGRRRDSG